MIIPLHFSFANCFLLVLASPSIRLFRPNEKLFLNYGFVLEDNFAETVFIKIGMQSDPSGN